jgi:hypothetical protein
MNIIKLFLGLMLLSCGNSDAIDALRLGNDEPIIIDVIDSDSNGDIEITKVVDLSSIINETSGLINFDGRLITHNDSGSEPILYEININSGEINREVKISNVTAVDIEDIAQDENFIYVCDIGNNSNTRRDQAIYKISKNDYLNKSEVLAEIISISYKEQTDFSQTNKATNFDAEAVVVMGNELVLFTKNWGDFRTSVYRIPTQVGTYEITEVDNYNIEGLITGADYNKSDNTIIMTGYRGIIPFVVKLSDFTENNPLNGAIEKNSIALTGSRQVEAIAVNPDGSYYISTEASAGFSAALYKMIY